MTKSILEAYQEMYTNYIFEELHPELREVIGSESIRSGDKLKRMMAHAKNLLSQGVDTGLEDGKPKKGSSRAVFFPREPKKINLDGKDTQVHSVVKVAFPGQLDKYHGEDTLLGQDQNQMEADHHLSRHYSVMHENKEWDDHPGWQSNHNGVLPPIFERHENDHYLEMGRAEKFKDQDMRNHTKNEDFPKGLSLSDVKNAMEVEHHYSHGRAGWATPKEAPNHEKIVDHPYVKSMISMMHDSDMHPADIYPQNMGVFVHPHTGHRYPVMIDYGFSNDIAKKYAKARRNLSMKFRGY